MQPQESVLSKGKSILSQKLANKTFYRFLFSFVAVIAGVLLFILILSINEGGGVR
ncbi:hypothetical protein KC906_03670 [Candidatus Kaiserbacteria bacterium]|nr:hypothetical protein [Candidatus Kaiserbacteria bacterium]MCB9812533.1 hypothetical protein [Candidatus Nomurabacteria bacterium]